MSKQQALLESETTHVQTLCAQLRVAEVENKALRAALVYKEPQNAKAQFPSPQIEFTVWLPAFSFVGVSPPQVVKLVLRSWRLGLLSILVSPCQTPSASSKCGCQASEKLPATPETSRSASRSSSGTVRPSSGSRSESRTLDFDVAFDDQPAAQEKAWSLVLEVLTLSSLWVARGRATFFAPSRLRRGSCQRVDFQWLLGILGTQLL